MARIMIDLSGVAHSYRTEDEILQAVKEADFQIEENTFTIMYGPSGSGKSTLLNIISGLQKPTRGRVLVENRDLYSLSPDELAFFRANRLGIVHQTTHWVRSLNVIENVSVPLYFLGLKRPVAEKVAMLVLDRVGMASYAKKSPLVLSGGEQQRISMARALSSNPLFVIADEPTGNLDQENSDKIMDLLQNCKSEFRCTVIMVTHNMEYVPLADKLITLNDGIAQALPAESMYETTRKLMTDLQHRINKFTGKKQI